MGCTQNSTEAPKAASLLLLDFIIITSVFSDENEAFLFESILDKPTNELRFHELESQI